MIIGTLSNVYAQFGSSLYVTTDLDYPVDVLVADLDNDGDLDVVAADLGTPDRIVWFENLDGLGNFGPENLVTLEAIIPREIHANDIDGDGDIDLISCSHDHDIAWYENLDGQGNFGPQILIDFLDSSGSTVFSSDINGDGHIDVITGTAPNYLAWYENTGADGAFGPPQIINTNIHGPSDIYTEDLDGDGDMDLLVSSSLDDKITWYENLDGLATFSGPNLITSIADTVQAVHAVDVDGDGDMDVLSASKSDGKIAWYENLDGLGNFGVQIIITSSAILATDVLGVDLNGDGNVDVLSSSAGEDMIAWYDNFDGAGTYSSRITIWDDVEMAEAVAAGDLTGDGAIDVLVASPIDGDIVWFEYGGTFGIEDKTQTIASLYPNPTAGELHFDTTLTIVEVSVINKIGQEILVTDNSESVNLAQLQSGLYFVSLEFSNGIREIHKVLKK
ncbi:MAG: hypothetical protein Aureis2KO_09820 [Aureisphaera sp.]